MDDVHRGIVQNLARVITTQRDDVVRKTIADPDVLSCVTRFTAAVMAGEPAAVGPGADALFPDGRVAPFVRDVIWWILCYNLVAIEVGERIQCRPIEHSALRRAINPKTNRVDYTMEVDGDASRKGHVLIVSFNPLDAFAPDERGERQFGSKVQAAGAVVRLRDAMLQHYFAADAALSERVTVLAFSRAFDELARPSGARVTADASMALGVEGLATRGEESVEALHDLIDPTGTVILHRHVEAGGTFVTLKPGIAVAATTVPVRNPEALRAEWFLTRLSFIFGIPRQWIFAENSRASIAIDQATEQLRVAISEMRQNIDMLFEEVNIMTGLSVRIVWKADAAAATETPAPKATPKRPREEEEEESGEDISSYEDEDEDLFSTQSE